MIGGVVSYIVINGVIYLLDKATFGRLRPDYTLRENWWTAAFSRSFTPYWIRYLIARARGKPIPWHEDDYDFGSDDENEHPDVVVRRSHDGDDTTELGSLGRTPENEKTSIY